MLKMKTI